jgi:hypothetical protein
MEQSAEQERCWKWTLVCGPTPTIWWNHRERLIHPNDFSEPFGQEAYEHFLLCEPGLKWITLDECSRPDRYLCLIFHVFMYGHCSCIYAEKARAS